MVAVVGVGAVYVVPLAAASCFLQLFVDTIGAELVVVELVLDGVGGVLDEGVEAVGGVLHVFVGLRAVEAPGAAVVLPHEVIPAVGVDATIAGELVVLRLALDHAEADAALRTHGAEDEDTAVVGDLIGKLVVIVVQDDELAGNSAVGVLQVLHLGNLNDLRDEFLGGVLDFKGTSRLSPRPPC